MYHYSDSEIRNNQEDFDLKNFTEELLKGFESEDSLDNGLVVRTFKIFKLLTVEHIIPRWQFSWGILDTFVVI